MITLHQDFKRKARMVVNVTPQDEEDTTKDSKDESPDHRMHLSAGDNVTQPDTEPLVHSVDMVDGLSDDVDPQAYGIEMEPEPEYQYGML